MFDADPRNVDKVWNSVDDLSAKIWLAATDSALKFKIEVIDDKHIQKRNDSFIWQGDSVQIMLHFPEQQNFWELGLAQSNDGKNLTWIWEKPQKYNTAMAKDIILRCVRNKNKTQYLATVPFKTLGITAKTLKKCFRFNMLINDNDLGVREGWIRVAPGMGNNKDSNLSPRMITE